MRMPFRRTGDRETDDREYELATGIRPPDHRFSTASANSEAVRQMERRILGPAWYRKRKPR